MIIDVNKLISGSETPEYTLRDVERTYKLFCANNNEEIEVEQPLGWINLTRRLVRDNEWHGFYLVHGDGQNEISFEATSVGYARVKEYYDAYGVDADVEIREFASSGATTVQIFAGRIDYSTFVESKVLFTVNIGNDSAYDKFKAKWETKGSTGSLAEIAPDVPDTTIDATKVALWGAPIVGSYLKEAKNISTEMESFNSGDPFLFLTYDTLTPEQNDITTVFEQEMGFSVVDPLNTGRSVAKFKFGGQFNINLRIAGTIRVQLVKKALTPQPKFATIRARTWLKRDGFPNVLIDEYINFITPINKDVDIPIDINYTDSEIQVTDNCNLYIYTEIDGDVVDNGTAILRNQRAIEGRAILSDWRLQITHTSLARQSLANFYKPLPLLNRVTYITTDDRMEVSSNVLDAGGCMEFAMITNGRKLRGDETAESDVRYSFREVMRSFQAIGGLGWGIEYDYNQPKQVIRIEPTEHFYQDEEIYAFGNDVFDFEESFNAADVFSNIQIGYKKYAEEGAGSTQEFHSLHDYKTPLKFIKGTLERTSDLIASSVLIEEQRRLAFDSENTSGGLDDDLFVLSCRGVSTSTIEAEISFMEVYQVELGQDDIEYEVPPENSFTIEELPEDFVIGQLLDITGTFSNNNVFTIKETFFSPYVNKWVVILEPDPVASQELNVLATIQIGGTVIQPEKNQNIIAFDLEASNRVYNMRYNPKYMLYNNHVVINACVAHRSATDKIATEKIIGNNRTTFQRLETDPCQQGDILLTASKMGEGVPLSAINGFEPIYIPMTVKFKAAMTHEQFVYLCNKLGRGGIDIEYGYVTYQNPIGVVEKGYIQEVRFTEMNNIAEVVIKKKRVA